MWLYRFVKVNIISALPLTQSPLDDKHLAITLTLMRAENLTDQIQEWWIVNQVSPGPIKKQCNGTAEEKKKCDVKKYDAGLEMYIFSDKVSPPSLGFLAGYGYVLIIARLQKIFLFVGISQCLRRQKQLVCECSPVCGH